MISSSPTDVKPVLDAVAMRAARICDATDTRIFLTQDDHFKHAAGFGDVGVMAELGRLPPEEHWDNPIRKSHH